MSRKLLRDLACRGSVVSSQQWPEAGRVVQMAAPIVRPVSSPVQNSLVPAMLLGRLTHSCGCMKVNSYSLFSFIAA